MFCVNTRKTFTSVDMIKDGITHRMNAWIITIHLFALACVGVAFSFFKASLMASAWGNGDDLQPHWKSWRKSKWISSGYKNSRLSLLALKQSTAASAEHSLPFRKPAPIYVSFPLRFIIFCSQSLHLIKDGMVMFIVPSRRTR